MTGAGAEAVGQGAYGGFDMMSRLLLLAPSTLALVTSAAGSARAQEAAAPWGAPNGGAVSIGYANGLWGSAFAQALVIKLPLHPHFGFVVRPMAVYEESSRVDVGGRVELYGASPVFLNFARIYGGGGVQVFDAVAGLPSAKPTVGGGGHFGFEFFYTPRSSFFIEIGGTSPLQGSVGGGGSAIAGVTFYPFVSFEPPVRAAARCPMLVPPSS
jgi:hypothetical protein